MVEQSTDYNQDASSSSYDATESIESSSTVTLTLDRQSSSGVSSSSTVSSMEIGYDNPSLSLDEEDGASRRIRISGLSVSACPSATNSLPSTSRHIYPNQNDLPLAERKDKRSSRIPWIMAFHPHSDTDPLTSPLELEHKPSCVPAYIIIFILLAIVLIVGGVTTLFDVRPAFFFPVPANSTDLDDFTTNTTTIL